MTTVRKRIEWARSTRSRLLTLQVTNSHLQSVLTYSKRWLIDFQVNSEHRPRMFLSLSKLLLNIWVSRMKESKVKHLLFSKSTISKVIARLCSRNAAYSLAVWVGITTSLDKIAHSITVRLLKINILWQRLVIQHSSPLDLMSQRQLCLITLLKIPREAVNYRQLFYENQL